MPGERRRSNSPRFLLIIRLNITPKIINAMKKNVLATILILFLSGIISSCSKEDEADVSNQPENSTESGDLKDMTPDGVEAIDLGLSVKWANMNIGATCVEENGDLYAWGETTPKSTYSKENYKYYHSGDSTYFDRIGREIKIIYDKGQYPSYDISRTEYDVAYVNWGGKWRMPTYKEMKELKDSCNWTWTTINDFYGYQVTGKNGNQIFLPAAGCGTDKGKSFSQKEGDYMTSTLVDKQHTPDGIEFSYFFAIDFEPNEVYFGNHGRIWGYSIRPVFE